MLRKGVEGDLAVELTVSEVGAELRQGERAVLR